LPIILSGIVKAGSDEQRLTTKLHVVFTFKTYYFVKNDKSVNLKVAGGHNMAVNFLLSNSFLRGACVSIKYSANLLACSAFENHQDFEMTFCQPRLILVRQYADQANSPHKAMRLRVQAIASSFHVYLTESNMRPNGGILRNNDTNNSGISASANIAGKSRLRSPASDSAVQPVPAYPWSSSTESNDIGYYGPASYAGLSSTLTPVLSLRKRTMLPVTICKHSRHSALARNENLADAG